MEKGRKENRKTDLAVSVRRMLDKNHEASDIAELLGLAEKEVHESILFLPESGEQHV